MRTFANPTIFHPRTCPMYCIFVNATVGDHSFLASANSLMIFSRANRPCCKIRPSPCWRTTPRRSFPRPIPKISMPRKPNATCLPYVLWLSSWMRRQPILRQIIAVIRRRMRNTLWFWVTEPVLAVMLCHAIELHKNLTFNRQDLAKNPSIRQVNASFCQTFHLIWNDSQKDDPMPLYLCWQENVSLFSGVRISSNHIIPLLSACLGSCAMYTDQDFCDNYIADKVHHLKHGWFGLYFHTLPIL